MVIRAVVAMLWLPFLAGGTAPSAQGVVPPNQSEESLMGRAFDGLSGTPVIAAQVAVPALGIGALANDEGWFSLRGFPDEPDRFELEITHPCFHTVRVEIDPIDTGTPLFIGLPFRHPRTREDRGMASECLLYGAQH